MFQCLPKNLTVIAKGGPPRRVRTGGLTTADVGTGLETAAQMRRRSSRAVGSEKEGGMDGKSKFVRILPY